MADKATLLFTLVILNLGFFSVSPQSTTGVLNETKLGMQKEQFPETENSTLPVLSRKRRYVVFPRGSSIQAAGCAGIHVNTPLQRRRYELGITLGLAWMLPSEAHELYLQKRDVDHTRVALTRAGYGVQHRVDMYKVLEGLLSVQGLKGRDCLLRAICEASETKQEHVTSGEHKRGTIIEELHKILFTLPVHPRHKTPYDVARQHAGQCGEVYSGCKSFLDIGV